MKTVNGSTAEKKERAVRASELAVLGMTYANIAKELGYASESGARDAVKRVFDQRVKTSYEAMRPILHERSELLWKHAWRRVNEAATSDEWERAMRQAFNALNYSARINRLVDPKTNVQVSVGSGGGLAELKREWLAMRAGHQQPALEGEVVEQADDTTAQTNEQDYTEV